MEQSAPSSLHRELYFWVLPLSRVACRTWPAIPAQRREAFLKLLEVLLLTCKPTTSLRRGDINISRFVGWDRIRSRCESVVWSIVHYPSAWYLVLLTHSQYNLRRRRLWHGHHSLWRAWFQSLACLELSETLVEREALLLALLVKVSAQRRLFYLFPSLHNYSSIQEIQTRHCQSIRSHSRHSNKPH